MLASSRVKSTQNLSRSTSLEMNGYLQRAIHNLNLRLQSFLLPQRAEISTQCTLKAFLSPQRPNVTRWLNYLPQRAEVLTHRSLQSFLSTLRANVTRWLNYFPQHEQFLITRTPDIKNGIDCACLRSYIRQILPISHYCTK